MMNSHSYEAIKSINVNKRMPPKAHKIDRSQTKMLTSSIQNTESIII